MEVYNVISEFTWHSACDLHYSSALVVTSSLSIPIQTNWKMRSYSILSLISRP